jgi:hypothetical protein
VGPPASGPSEEGAGSARCGKAERPFPGPTSECARERGSWQAAAQSRAMQSRGTQAIGSQTEPGGGGHGREEGIGREHRIGDGTKRMRPHEGGGFVGKGFRFHSEIGGRSRAVVGPWLWPMAIDEGAETSRQ